MDIKDLGSIPPEVFTVIGEVLGTLEASNMPLNVQNSVGNWLELIGQAILTYNAQQQLLEQGPGDVYGCPTPPDRLAELERRIAALEKTVTELSKYHS